MPAYGGHLALNKVFRYGIQSKERSCAADLLMLMLQENDGMVPMLTYIDYGHCNTAGTAMS